MPISDEVKTLGRARLSFADEADIDEFVATLGRYERGELTADQWRAFRLVRGTYGQRQTGDIQMLRVKIPQGVLSAHALQALADVSERYSRGFGHITTRQNVQFHFVPLSDVPAAMVRLAEAGLTTREACGNSVRNITACPYAGTAQDEVFDITPYAEAMTRYFLRHPLSSSLPRKFKIGFEGCPEDHAGTAINDIGWRARLRREGTSLTRGFSVAIGGGTAILCRSGAVLHPFLPASEILNVAEAVLRVFHKLGDYKHKQRNRMKFLIRELGWERWREEYEKTLAEVQAAGGARLGFDPENPPVESPPDWPPLQAPSLGEVKARLGKFNLKGPGQVPRPFTGNADLSSWLRTNVKPQRQAGYSLVTVTTVLGDLTGAQMRISGDLALAYGDGSVRVTREQNLVFRWIRTADVRELHRLLHAAGLGLPGAGTPSDVVSCPGAESCRLAVTQSRGLGRLLGDFLRSRPDLAEEAPDLQLKISGCPNGCGQHHIAGIGFQGSVRKLGTRVLPQYFVMVGGTLEETGARFGRLAAKIPARRLSEALERLIHLYKAEHAEGQSATAFFASLGVERARAVLADLENIQPTDASDSDFVDLGEDAEFKVETMDGECSA